MTKELISLVACVLILAVFLVQLVSFEVVQTKILYVETAVNSAVEIAKQDGYFTDSNIASLKNKIAARVGCDASEITVTATSSPVSRGHLISYTIHYPIKNVIGSNKLLGIDDADNVIDNVVAGTAASEYLP